MKNVSITTALVLSFSLLLVVPATAAAETGTANAEIVGSIAIANTGPLEFGQIIAGPAGTVAISTASTRTSPSATLNFALGTAPAAATFEVTGGANAAYSITLPVDGGTLTGPGAAMVLSSFVSSPATTGLLSGAGAETLSVGATLTVAAAQVVGAYTGTFDVTVAYD